LFLFAIYCYRSCVLAAVPDISAGEREIAAAEATVMNESDDGKNWIIGLIIGLLCLAIVVIVVILGFM